MRAAPGAPALARAARDFLRLLTPAKKKGRLCHKCCVTKQLLMGERQVEAGLVCPSAVGTHVMLDGEIHQITEWLLPQPAGMNVVLTGPT